MRKPKVILALILYGTGLIGILSILTMEIPIPPEAEAILKDRFTPQQIKLLILINPALILAVSVVVGTLLFKKVHLSVPLIENWAGVTHEPINAANILKFGTSGGVLSGLLLSLTGLVFYPFLPSEFIELGESLKPSLPARFLYGGITEEILMRYGLMTLLVWIASKIFRGTTPPVYWIGIIISSLIFALGHFPIAYQAVADPSAGLLSYILIGNTVGGLVFGWLYWKKGLESAFLAHIFAHVIMVLGEPLLR